MPDGTLSTDMNDVMNRWEAGYGSLFSSINDDIEKNLYADHVRGLNAEFEQNMTFGPFVEYDRDFSRSKVQYIVNKSKDNKAPGHDGIVNEFIKMMFA